MKLINYGRDTKFGELFYFTLLQYKRYALLQCSFSWDDEPGLPYIQITSGYGKLLSVLFCAYRFGFDIDLLGRVWYKDEDITS
jgi:hypothetical protein